MPAGAIIPAPRAYVRVAAFEKIIVCSLPRTVGPPLRVGICMALGTFFQRLYLHFIAWSGTRNLYFVEIRAFEACTSGEYISME